MSVRSLVAPFVPAQAHLKESMKKLRYLEVKLIESRSPAVPVFVLVEIFQLLTTWDESGLTWLIAEFDQVNFIGDFDKVLKSLVEIQQKICMAVAEGVLVTARGADARIMLVLNAETREELIKLIGDLEFEDSDART